jgi:hypothetical protein
LGRIDILEIGAEKIRVQNVAVILLKSGLKSVVGVPSPAGLEARSMALFLASSMSSAYKHIAG